VLILGVDPGSLRTGWGLIAGTSACPQIVECDLIRLTPSAPFPDRLHALQVAFEQLVRRVQPTSAAVEAPFHGVNARASFQLAHARGVLLAVLAGEGIPVSEYSPATVKKAVTGNGRAEKQQVQSMILKLLGPGTVHPSFDVADALAVALCHAASLGLRSALERATRRGAP